MNAIVATLVSKGAKTFGKRLAKKAVMCLVGGVATETGKWTFRKAEKILSEKKKEIEA